MDGVDVVYFPYEKLLEVGSGKMNQELLDLVKKEKPDIFFAVMFTDELRFDVLDEIKKYTKSVAWFCDDHWRFDNYSRFYAPHFSWVVTTYSKAVDQYKKIGCHNAILSQWAFNDFNLRPTTNTDNKNYGYDVSFVGQRNWSRARIIKKLRKAGIEVEVFGSGWENGRVSPEKMREIFCSSKINLNLNPPQSGFDLKSLGRLFLRRSSNRYVLDFWHLPGNIREWLQKRTPQIKARPFEIAGYGGFVISGQADNIEDYYRDGKEMVFYKNTDDLIKKIRYYINNEKDREAIARAGHEKTMREHTYKIRFSDIFNKVLSDKNDK